MATREEAQKILDKYDWNYAKLSRNSKQKEFRTVLRHVAAESNRLQRKAVDLDKE